jgi:hypothetical protein
MQELRTMNKTLIAAALLASAAGAQAAGLSWTELSQGAVNQYFDPSPSVGLAGVAPTKDGTISLGQLTANVAGTITFTYLGQESGFADGLELVVGSGAKITETTVGSSVSADIGAGVVDFEFFDSNSSVTVNGGSWTKGSSIGLLTGAFATTGAAGSLPAGSSFDYVLGFNDSGTGHDDWDDYVVGVNFTAAVPEPETYALMLAGLAGVGFMARRRQRRG